MKSVRKTIFICLLPLLSYSQAEPPSTVLQNLAPPNSPAFVLMDITPSNIVIPDNIQSFSIQTISAFADNSNNGLSNNNYAVEFQPYWYVKRQHMNFFKYNNFTSDKADGTILSVDDYTGYNIFGDIWKKASFSLAMMNGSFEVFDKAQSYISVGARTRLISVRQQNQLDKLKTAYKAYIQLMGGPEVMAIVSNRSLTKKEKNQKIIALAEYKKITDKFDELVKSKPVFSLDFACAYSHFLGDKSQDFSDAFGRFGVWLSGDLALKTPSLGKESYVHFYGMFRYLRDGINIDENGLFIENKIDVGGKIELEFNKLSFAYEFISRDSDSDEESRSIGSIRYKINDSFTLNGGFGKNFSSEDNLVTLFGIQWGLDNKSTVKLTPN